MCWRRPLRVPWTARRSNQLILKKEYSLEELMLKLKLQYFGHLMGSWLTGKDPDAGKDWGQEEKGGNRWGDGWMAPLTQWTWVWANSGTQWRTGSLMCCSLWGHKESDTTQQLNTNNNLWEFWLLHIPANIWYCLLLNFSHPGRLITMISLWFITFIFLATPWGMWDLSFPTRDQICNPFSGSIEFWPLDQEANLIVMFNLQFPRLDCFFCFHFCHLQDEENNSTYLVILWPSDYS